MAHQTFNFSIGKTTFFGQYWKVDNAKANIILIHGMGEHSSRYNGFFANKMNDAGFSVIAFDHYGHGKTTGKRGDCPSHNAVLDSVDVLIQKCNEYLGENAPKILYGHSMGGNVVANHILKRKNNIKVAVLSSPMLKLAFEPPAWKLFAGKIMRNIYPSFQESTGLESNAISRDKTEVDKYNNDPLVHDKITVNFSLPFFEAGDWAIENADKLKIPTLVIHGTADRLTSHKGSEQFIRNAGNNAELKLYDGGYHELHNDIVKEEVLNDVVAWLNEKL